MGPNESGNLRRSILLMYPWHLYTQALPVTTDVPLLDSVVGGGMGMKIKQKVMETSESTATVEVGDQASTERIITGRPLEEGPFVGTLPQELSSSELTDEPVVFRKKILRCPTEATEVPEKTRKSECCPTG